MSVRVAPVAASSSSRASMEGLSMRPALSAAVVAFQAVSRVGAEDASVIRWPWRGKARISSAAAPERASNGAVLATMQKQSGRRGGLGPMGMVGAVLGGLAAGAGAAHLLHTRGGKPPLDLL